MLCLLCSTTMYLTTGTYMHVIYQCVSILVIKSVVVFWTFPTFLNCVRSKNPFVFSWSILKGTFVWITSLAPLTQKEGIRYSCIRKRILDCACNRSEQPAGCPENVLCDPSWMSTSSIKNIGPFFPVSCHMVTQEYVDNRLVYLWQLLFFHLPSRYSKLPF